jgi:hypothetical protein
MSGKRSFYYGKLMTETLPNEVKRIWHSRDDELPELPRYRWSFDLHSDMEQVEQRELIVKLLETICFTEREDLVVQMIVMDGATLEEASKELGVTKERIRQIYMKAMQKARVRQKEITGTMLSSINCNVTTWNNYRYMLKRVRQSTPEQMLPA